MSIFDALFLGIIQGITEFLPISSSGHLLIFENIFGLEITELRSFDVMVHLGTLTAILIYFWKDIIGILSGFFFLDRSKNRQTDRRLGWIIILGSIPAALAGYFLNDIFDQVFRSLNIVGISMIAIGLLFFAAEKWPTKKNKKEVTWIHAVFIGLAQALALIPGISRSGSTIAAGLFQGIDRTKAARFSFLLGAPAIFGAGLITFRNATFNPQEYFTLGIGFLTSAIVGFLAVSFLMKFLKNHTLRGFGIYLILLGALTLILVV